MYVIGFDPGGIDKFGWAVLDDLRLIASGTCTGALAALSAARAATPGAPAAIGIDAPLFWAQAGDRESDKTMRDMVSASGGSTSTVNHVNSLRGACLVEGIQVARLAAEQWPSAKITEAHPKALLAVSPAALDFVRGLGATKTEHERDAALAAFAAHALATQADGWHDLAAMENAPFFPGGKPVAYWAPNAWARS